MRMNSAADLARLAGLFSFIPPSLIDEAGLAATGRGARRGQGLTDPILVRFGGRVAEEGGGDVKASWARPLSAGAVRGRAPALALVLALPAAMCGRPRRPAPRRACRTDWPGGSGRAG